VIYRVVHRTEYRYESAVSSSFGELYLLPRDAPGQVCRSSRVHIDPGPHDYRERTDFYGNRVAAFAVLEPHTTLAVTAESVVDVSGRPGSSPPPVEQPWEMVRDRLGTDPQDDTLEARDFLLESPKVTVSPSVAAYAAESFTAGRPLTEALTELVARIHDDFAYKPGATTVRTTLVELLERREGVCQDFAHLAVGCLRSVGLAARYVSGYLETAPPPGRPRLVGADVSHAWASVFVPGLIGDAASPGVGWIDLDPTNNRFVTDRYVTTAWGRDYGDVPPLKGVIYTESTEDELRVSVDVAPLDAPPLDGSG
jgi:transglutaminase-like putative cysteine protease